MIAIKLTAIITLLVICGVCMAITWARVGMWRHFTRLGSKTTATDGRFWFEREARRNGYEAACAWACGLGCVAGVWWLVVAC